MSSRPLRTNAAVPAMESSTRCTLAGICALARRRGVRLGFAARARLNRCSRSASDSCRARATASRTSSETPLMWPFSSRMYQSVLTPAITATSSRRSPGTRRRPPAGSPTCSGVSLARRVARKSRISVLLSTVSTLRASAPLGRSSLYPPITQPPAPGVGRGLVDDVTTSPTTATATDRPAMPAIGIENTHVRGSHVSGRGSSAPIGDRHAGLALAAAVLGFFVVTLDAVVVNVTLPVIRTDLGGGVAGLQWAVDGYTLMFAALLLSAGSLSDRVGARRAFAAGMVVFVLASVACGLGPSLGELVAARF